MNFLVVGCGSVGKRHLNNLIKIGINKNNIYAIDTREDRLEEVKSIGISNVFNSLDEALKFDIYASIVCSPTSMHIEQSLKLLNNNINILMEKPLCSNLDGIDEVIKLKDAKNLTFMMAYVFRFSPMTIQVKQMLKDNEIGKILYARGEFSEYLPDWHPWEDYRHFYMAKKELGGGSILDQCHIMDLFHYLFGKFSSVYAYNTKISELEIQADDIAEMIIHFENNIVGSIHTDIFGRQHKKKFEIKGTEGNITWDFYDKKVTLYKSSTNTEDVFNNFDEDFNNCYIEELNTFIAACSDKTISIPNLDVGIDTMKLIVNSEKSHNTKKLEKI
tara:strand:- start:2248 stop:3240 length:993 start_codon:yes stop_codon:yes gene_type:complete